MEHLGETLSKRKDVEIEKDLDLREIETAISNELKGLFLIVGQRNVDKLARGLIASVKELGPKIMTTDIVLADATSGILPSILFYRIMELMRPDNLPSLHYPLLGRRSRQEKHDVIEELVRDMEKKGDGGRKPSVLVVTEYIGMGRSLWGPLRALQKAGVNVTTITLGRSPFTILGRFLPGAMINASARRASWDLFHDKEYLHGAGNYPGAIHARPIKQGLSALNETKHAHAAMYRIAELLLPVAKKYSQSV